MKTKTPKTARITKAPRKSRKATILGLAIEGADHKAPRTEIADYIDAEGMELPELVKGLTTAKQAEKDQKFIERQKAKQEREEAKQYRGAAIPATRVYRRDMPEFKNCKAECWMLVNEHANTYTFANTYNDKLKASYQADHYTYALTEKAQKKVAKKQEEMIEVEVTEWPLWIQNATAKGKAAELKAIKAKAKAIKVRLSK